MKTLVSAAMLVAATLVAGCAATQTPEIKEPLLCGPGEAPFQLNGEHVGFVRIGLAAYVAGSSAQAILVETRWGQVVAISYDSSCRIDGHEKFYSYLHSAWDTTCYSTKLGQNYQHQVVEGEEGYIYLPQTPCGPVEVWCPLKQGCNEKTRQGYGSPACTDTDRCSLSSRQKPVLSSHVGSSQRLAGKERVNLASTCLRLVKQGQFIEPSQAELDTIIEVLAGRVDNAPLCDLEKNVGLGKTYKNQLAVHLGFFYGVQTVTLFFYKNGWKEVNTRMHDVGEGGLAAALTTALAELLEMDPRF
jgi:hypothetical protein